MPSFSSRSLPALMTRAMSSLLLLGAESATADAQPSDGGGFCCWFARDNTDFCGTCHALADSRDFCSRSRLACGSCGAGGHWCEQSTEGNGDASSRAREDSESAVHASFGPATSAPMLLPEATPTPRAEEFDSSAVYVVESVRAPGEYLNVDCNAVRNGANIHLWDNPERSSTQWRIARSSEGSYTFENANAAGKYLSVYDQSVDNGASIHLWDDPESSSTQWRIARASDGAIAIENANAGGRYLNVVGDGSENGVRIQLWDNPENPSTQWRIIKAPAALPPESFRHTDESSSCPEEWLATKASTTLDGGGSVHANQVSSLTTTLDGGGSVHANQVSSLTTTLDGGGSVHANQVSSLTPNVQAVRQHGRLRVAGNKIVGEHGLPVRLRGVSMFWSQWMGQFWSPDAVRWLKRDWHVSVIRAAMGVEKDGYLDNPDAEKAKLQAVVDACIEEGIYVVIDWHDYHAEQHVERAKAFFGEVAAKYGGTPNVLFETYNEPEKVSWRDTIKPYHEQIVPVIRKYSDNIIILGTGTWSQEVDVASRDPVLGENLAYTFHFYAASMGADLRSRVSDALRNGVAIFATEWGACESTGDGRLDFQETQAWLDFLEENFISDSNWAVSDKDESCSALRGGASGSGGWSESDLTESGQFVRSSIRDYNANGALSSSVARQQSPRFPDEQIFVRKHSRMRGPTSSTGVAGPHVVLATLAVVACAGALTLSLAQAARGPPSSAQLQGFLAVEGQPPTAPTGAEVVASIH